MRCSALVALVGCGRFAFDPRADASRDATPPSYAIISATTAGTIAAFTFDGTMLVENAPRPTPQAQVDALAVHGGHVFAAGANLTVYDIDGSGAAVRVAEDGGGQYANGLMRLAFHPTLPVMYLTGDGAASTNVLVYDLADAKPTERMEIGDEPTPCGIDPDPTGAVVFTTGGRATGTICRHAADVNGGLATSTCNTSCDNALALAVAPAGNAVIVICVNTLAVHALDAALQPGTAMISGFDTAQVKAVARGVDAVFVALDRNIVQQLDPVTGAVRDFVPVRDGTTGIALTPDGRYLIGGDPMGVAAYDLTTKQLVAASAGDAGGLAVAIAVLVR